MPGEQPQKKVIKINTNECPYPPSPRVVDALKEADWEKLRLYPDAICRDLTESLAAYYGVKKEQVFVGVGSDDVLSMCYLAYFNGPDPVLFPDITYSFYDVWAEVYRIPFRSIPLTEDFSIDPADYRVKNGGIVIANPNAPTGREQSLDDIEDIVSHNQNSVVLVDEAYADFGRVTALPLIEKYDNVAVVRTMSKSRAMAGMRIGYLISNEKLIKYINDVKYSVNSYTMNLPSLLAGKAAIEDDEYFRGLVSRVIKTREDTSDRLKAMGWTLLPSSTNFVFAKPPAPHEAVKIFQALREREIYVRHFDKPRISDYLRISMGTEEEMDAFFDALESIMR